MRGGASILLHRFVIEVFDYFNLVLFQITPNSICIMVAFYIAFKDANIVEPSAVEFAYIYCIKALRMKASGIPISEELMLRAFRESKTT